MGLVRELIRSTARAAGMDIRRWPESDPLWRVSRLLRAKGIDVVLDVGANDGEYASTLRRHGFERKIVSFEPVASAFRGLEANALADEAWYAVQLALGAVDEDVVINVAGNNATSSSILPMLDRHLESAPTSAYVSSEKVRQRRLDDVLSDIGVGPEDRVFLKLDVQGYERHVLDGATDLLASDRLLGLQTELSLTPLYDRGTQWRDAVDRVLGAGMTLMSLDPGWTDLSSGQMLQADAVFFRE